MEKEEFESYLGDLVITKSHFERSERVGEEWEEVKDAFDEEEIVDEVHFSDVEDLEHDPDEFFPCVRVKVEDVWKKVVFAPRDDHEAFFKRLRYRLKSYRQVYE